MPWLKISVEAAGASAEALSERMLACGALSVSFGASGVVGDEVLEPPPGAVPLWPRVTLSGLFPPAVDAQALNSALGAIGASRIEWLRDQDWVAPRSRDVPELRFGDRLAVVPRDGEHIPTAQSRAGRPPPKGAPPHPAAAPARGRAPHRPRRAPLRQTGV
ncbi:MAG: 50S ribosomal protein L11 methyltransferase, partial [Gammaproteobacteria bacterium]|nr:50S ribosomal protein L11 methyltransferase [Gammaproteobacteria bacterium]